MRTDIDSLWVIAFFSKCEVFTHKNIAWSILIIVLALLVILLINWTYPGGSAWANHRHRTSNPRNKNPIPGPRGLPLIGSMNLMTSLSHQKLAAEAIKCKAKRLMAFSVGITRMIVTCNPDVAKEILNSPFFVDRPIKESAYSLMFNRAIGFAPYGLYWRTLRRISATHLFSPKQIKATESQRRVIASQMVSILKNHQNNVTVRGILKRASLNNMMSSVFGKECRLDTLNDEVEELRGLVDEGYELLGTLNWADHLPWLGDLDPQRIWLRCSRLVPRVTRFVSRIIDQHRGLPKDETRDFVDVLLSLQGPEKLSDFDMIAVLWEMIFRGTDTVAVLIEWVLARIVLHPHIQSMVHNELDKVIGRSHTVNESDVSSLIYLQAVVKEVLRLHPPGPLLSWARLATSDTTVDGRHVPKATVAMVNMWAISRDPELWADPVEFRPERFLVKDGEPEFSVFGSDLRLAPFGSGKRACPGKNLAMTTVTFWVSSLLHEFEWMPLDGNKVDLSEVLKLSCQMANPLAVQVKPRRY